MPSIASIRARFPGLSGSTVLLDNAGGSQLPASVIEAMAAYMRGSFVQTGAGYALSQRAGETVAAAHAWVNRIVGGEAVGSVILGPSSTQLCHLLAGCYRSRLAPGDEIVIAECGHEANIGPWVALERQGVVIRWWRAGDDPTGCPLAALDTLLGPRTRLLCVPHASNLLGGVVDVAEVTRRAHAVGARVVVDGVAFAPHRPMDVAAWGCDWYIHSTYKVYGPHMGALFGRHEAIAELDGPNHYFIPRTSVPYVFELGGACHEGCAGLLGLREHLAFLAGSDQAPADVDRATTVRAFEAMAELEAPLQRRLVEGLSRLPGVRIIGPPTFGPERVATVSFVHERVPSRTIAAQAHRRDIGIRHGHAYAHRLVKALGLDPDDGVVRISAVHYSTLEEIDQALDAVKEAIG